MAVVATGFFDGVHKGHRAVIDTLLRLASSRGEESVVVTFWPHPRTVLQQDARGFTLLQSREEKIAMLKQCGVDRVVEMKFTKEFASLTAGQYLEMLRREYAASCIVLGYDNRFGSDGLSTSDIARIASSMGIDAVVADVDTDPDGTPVSSTRIRMSLAQGRVGEATQMLTRPYEICGVVVSGNMMGRTIDFPTANLKLREPLKALPQVGAYFTSVSLDGQTFHGMTNIDANGKIETHILDFSADVYGHDLAVRFERRLRDELRFNSFEELKEQLLRDLAECRYLMLGSSRP